MAKSSRQLKPKTYVVDENMVHRAKRLLRTDSDTDAIQISLERLIEAEEFWKFMDETGGTLSVDSIEEP